MVSFTNEEQVSEQNIIRNFTDFVDKLKNGVVEKIAVIKNNKTEAIIISLDEYKKLEEIYDLFEHVEIYKAIKDRLKTPKSEYISYDNVLKQQGFL